MATKLFLRNTQANGIGATYFDLLTTAGSGAATSVTNTTAGGTEIQCTATAGGSVVQWISGRAPLRRVRNSVYGLRPECPGRY